MLNKPRRLSLLPPYRFGPTGLLAQLREHALQERREEPLLVLPPRETLTEQAALSSLQASNKLFDVSLRHADAVALLAVERATGVSLSVVLPALRPARTCVAPAFFLDELMRFREDWGARAWIRLPAQPTQRSRRRGQNAALTWALAQDDSSRHGSISQG